MRGPIPKQRQGNVGRANDLFALSIIVDVFMADMHTVGRVGTLTYAHVEVCNKHNNTPNKQQQQQ